MVYSVHEVGVREKEGYKAYIYHEKQPISPFHDIPLWVDKAKGVANMVCEIPRDTQAKMEINKEEVLNPLKQDIKNGKLRYVALKYPFNYGALPQTWENPEYVHPDTKAKGDNDPIDAVEIGGAVAKFGEIKHVKILGTYAMIDEGETDWKIVCIDVNDPNASKINDHNDIEKVFPGKLKAVFEFLRDYKIPDGKPANVFAFNSELKDKAFALHVTEECHAEWQKLVKEGRPKISTHNTTHAGHPHHLSAEDADKKIKGN